MKELQRLISFHCYNDVHGGGDSKKTVQLQELAFQKYHGNTHLTQPSQEEDHISCSDQFLKGAGMFEFLFRTEQDFQEGDDVLVLKEIFSCQKVNRIIVSDKKADQGINKQVVTSKSLTNFANIAGRNIWDNGKAVERNGKKALALLEHSEYKQHVDDGKTPSGTIYEDCLLFIRCAMCKELKGDKSDKEDEEEADDVEDTESNSAGEGDDEDDMPDIYFFPVILPLRFGDPSCHQALTRTTKPTCSSLLSKAKRKRRTVVTPFARSRRRKRLKVAAACQLLKDEAFLTRTSCLPLP